MEKIIVNRPTLEEIEFLKRMGTVDQARRLIVEAGGFFLFQQIIDDPTFRKDLLVYAKNHTPRRLSYVALLKWFQENKLEKHLSGGSLEKQIKWQEEVFYRKFYGENFCLDRSKLFVSAERLPAIKAGLKVGCLNYVLIKATPEILSEVETQMTGAEFFFQRLLKPSGIRIWAESGTDRWTGLTLAELLQRCLPVEPEEFNAVTFKNDWVAEAIRLIEAKGAVSGVGAGATEIIFTSDLSDIPRDQVIVNKYGEVADLDNRSYISVVAKKVRVLSYEEGIILPSQLFAKNNSYIASNTWEWRRDLIDHRDKNVNPLVSVAYVYSRGGEVDLSSCNADDSGSAFRFRLAL